MGIQLMRNGSYLQTIDEYVAWTGTTANSAIGSSDFIYLDSPATTSSTTYASQFANIGATGTCFINVTATLNAVSTITLMEIAQ
jgi:hypothetical protein